MPHTPEQRDRHALCGAKRKAGGTCRLFAGQGTTHPGVGRCRFHLGSTRNHEQHAVRIEAQQRLVAFGEPLPIEPTEALLRALQLTAGHLEYVRGELSALEDKSSFQGQVLLRVYSEERDRLARVAKSALDAGVQERAVKLAEAYGELLARLIQGILGDLSLTRRQQADAPQVVRRHLIAMDTGKPAP